MLSLVLAAGCYRVHEGEHDRELVADGSHPGLDGARPIHDAAPRPAEPCEVGAPCDCRAAEEVPAGTHWIGIPWHWHGASPYQSPVHRIHLTRPFWAGTYQASAGCYRRCLEAGGCTEPELPEQLLANPRWVFGSRYWQDPDWADHPIGGLSWEDARAYCVWLGGRLPTNAEWEKLARGEDGRDMPWDEPPVDWEHRVPGHRELCERSHAPEGTCDRASPILVPIDTYPQGVGPYGHLHLTGNAAEWVADSVVTYGPDDRWDPLDQVPGVEPVVRGQYGASWYRNAWSNIALNRIPIGVRCAFDVAPEPLFR